jgi:predicted dehydrogenase
VGRRLCIGVLGYGYWGSKHVRVLTAEPDVDVVIIEQHLDRISDAAIKFPNARVVGDLDAVLPDLDGVVIATAANSHAKLATVCLEAGVGVLVEKPLATTAEDALMLANLADQLGLVLMVGHTFEFNPAVRMLRDMVQSGTLGTVRYIDTSRLNLGLYQPDVNVIWDLAPHDISILNYLLDSRPTHVSAWARSNVVHGLADVAHLQVEYEDPQLNAYVHVSWLDPKKVRRVTVVGSEKMAVYDDLNQNEPIRVYDMGVDLTTSAATPERPLTYRYGDIWSPHVDGGEPLAIEDHHFVSSIRAGTRPLVDGWSGHAVVQALEAAATSCSSEGERISLNTERSRVEAPR